MADLVSLVVQSKKALQQAESICSNTNNTAKHCATIIVDILATEAKVKWLTEGVTEQLLAASKVVEAIQNQRATLQAHASRWDQERNQRAIALDSILESLAQQAVPPSLHEMAEASSLFGEQHSNSPVAGRTNAHTNSNGGGRNAPTGVAGDTGFLRTFEEIRRFQDSQHGLKDQSKWRSLRDFVDERGIDEAADAMDADRNALDVLLRSTASFPDGISRTISEINAKLLISSASTMSLNLSPSAASPPPPPSLLQRPSATTSTSTSTPTPSPTSETIQLLLAQHETLKNEMARNLESLAMHFDQMSRALRDHQRHTNTDGDAAESASPQHFVGSAETYRPPPGGNGTGVGGLSPPKDSHAKGVAVPPRARTPRTITEEDMQVFVRDTEELPAILADIEGAASQVNDIQDRLRAMARSFHASLDQFDLTIDQLDRLADDMSVKMQLQRQVETQSYELHTTLDAHLSSFDQLAQTYVDYQTAYRRLLLEMDRRRRSREAMEELVHEMFDKLEQMREDEIVARESFILQHGQVLPDDLCPFVQDLPVRWAVDVIGEETLPDIQESILVEARQQLERSGAAHVPDVI